MEVRQAVARTGAAFGIAGAGVGYVVNWLHLSAVDCSQGAYTLSCATIADKIAFMLGNFGSVVAAAVCALPGLAIYLLAQPKDHAPPE